MSFRLVDPDEAFPLIACAYAAGRVGDRFRRRRGPRNNPRRDYGLTDAEIPEWRRMVRNRHFTSREAADILLRSRRP